MNKLLLLALVSFGSLASQTTLSDSGLWYSHDSGLDHPKYSGGLATATSKTMPTAMRGANGKNYYTWSECRRSDSEDEFRVYVGMTDGTKAVVHRTSGPKSWGLCDQHDNAAIRVASDGYIWVHKAARGDWRKSHMYKSIEPWDITRGFRIIETGYKAYPQSWSMGLIYTRYNKHLREPWVLANRCEKKLVEGGHYNVSLWDGEYIHLFYNYHRQEDLDQRVNVYYMRSRNGCDWENKDGKKLTLPLEPDSELTKVLDTEGFVYLKDVRVGEKPELLAVLSESNNPLESADRELVVINTDAKITSVTQVGHNYDSGCFMSDKYIVTPISNQFGYNGGDLHVFDLSGRPLNTINTKGAANYCKKIFGASGMIYSDSTSSEVENGVDVVVYK